MIPSKQHFDITLKGETKTVYACYYVFKSDEWDGSGNGNSVEFDWITDDKGEHIDCHDSIESKLVADQIFYFNQ
jgi:hypothetical protein